MKSKRRGRKRRYLDHVLKLVDRAVRWKEKKNNKNNNTKKEKKIP